MIFIMKSPNEQASSGVMLEFIENYEKVLVQHGQILMFVPYFLKHFTDFGMSSIFLAKQLYLR